MNISKKFLLQFCLALACATGCSQESSPKVDQSHHSKIYSEAELDKLITPGMSLADVTNKFGPPGVASKMGEGAVLFVYSFPFEGKREPGDYMTGFSIDAKDGRVVRWSPVTSRIGKTVKASQILDSFGEQSVQIYLAIGGLTNMANEVSVEGSADASDLKAFPMLILKAQVSAGPSGNERLGEQTVHLLFSDDGASRLKIFTHANLGKRTLVVCRGKVIAAPWISEPVTTTQLVFTVKSAAVLDTLRGN